MTDKSKKRSYKVCSLYSEQVETVRFGEFVSKLRSGETGQNFKVFLSVSYYENGINQINIRNTKN